MKPLFQRIFRICVISLVALSSSYFAEAKNLLITDFGAIADSQTNNAPAIQNAINAAAELGGGRVIVPEGTFLTGTIEIKSNVTLHLEKDGKLLGSSDISDAVYPPISPGYQSFVARPDVYPEKVLIYAKNAHDVAITGSGTIDGNGMHDNLRQESNMSNRLKCINLIRFIQCSKVKMLGDSSKEMLLITNSGHWAVQPMNCDDVYLQYVSIREYGGVTPDGLPISDCRNVLVEDCFISADDDALGLKNGSPEIIVENIVVKRTVFESTNTGFKSGSPQSFGPFRDVSFIGCTFKNLSESMRQNNYGEHHGFFVGILNGGGSYENVLIEDCIIDDSKMPFAMYIANIRAGYWSQWWLGKDAVNQFGTVINVTIRNVSYQNPRSYGVLIEGREGYEIENLVLENVYLPSAGGEPQITIPEEKTSAYPDMARSYGKMPAYGFFLRHVKNVTMKNVWTWTELADERPCVVAINVSDFDDSGLHQGEKPKNYLPAISFDSVVLSESEDWIQVKANARDHDGYIERVSLMINDQSVAELREPPYAWSIKVSEYDLNSDIQQLKLIAFDDSGASSQTETTISLKMPR